VETQNSASRTTYEIDDKNQIEEQFTPAQAFHRTPDGRVRKITDEVQFGLGNLELFDPVTIPDNHLQQSESQHEQTSMAEIKEPKKNSYTRCTDEASRLESWTT
jgi:hypothetical protein